MKRTKEAQNVVASDRSVLGTASVVVNLLILAWNHAKMSGVSASTVKGLVKDVNELQASNSTFSEFRIGQLERDKFKEERIQAQQSDIALLWREVDKKRNRDDGRSNRD